MRPESARVLGRRGVNMAMHTRRRRQRRRHTHLFAVLGHLEHGGAEARRLATPVGLDERHAFELIGTRATQLVFKRLPGWLNDETPRFVFVRRGDVAWPATQPFAVCRGCENSRAQCPPAPIRCVCARSALPAIYNGPRGHLNRGRGRRRPAECGESQVRDARRVCARDGRQARDSQSADCEQCTRDLTAYQHV